MVREDLQRLIEVVSGRTVFILGGGTSITPETLQLLNDNSALVLGLNSSAKYINKVCGVLWCDSPWGATNMKYLDSVSAPKFFVSNTGSNYIKTDIRTTSRSTVLNKTGDFGFDVNIDNVRGNNSGAYSINLLVNCKAAKIGLIGYDMHTVKGKAHFHNEYTYSIRPSVYPELFIPSIESMAKALKDSGNRTKIYNCNQFSSLKCFEFKKIEEML